MVKTSGGGGITGVTFGLPYKNVDPFIAGIVHSGRASLHELRTIYDLRDAYDMWEFDYVPAFNDYLRAKREQEHKKNMALFQKRK